MTKKDFWKRLWKFYWKDNSIASYVFFIVVTYVVFKFVLLPGFLFITGLSDVVAIMTSSMEHSDFVQYYYYTYFEELNYTSEEIDNFPYSEGLYIGDVILAREKESYEVGDVIVFQSDYYPDKLVHRVVSTDPVVTKGDNNPTSYVFDLNVKKVVGEVVFRIPYLGLPRYWMYKLLGV
jgi:hypothetical protein